MHKMITIGLLPVFTLFASIPVCAQENINNQESFKKEAIFGRCKAKRMKKKLERLENYLRDFKNDLDVINELTYLIYEIKQDIKKDFKKNVTVEKIMSDVILRIENGISTYKINSTNQINELKTESKVTPILSRSSIQQFQNHMLSLEKTTSKVRLFKDAKRGYLDRDDPARGLGDKADKELYAYILIFTGCLLTYLPFGITQGVGLGLISQGVYILGEIGFISDDQKTENNNINKRRI